MPSAECRNPQHPDRLPTESRTCLRTHRTCCILPRTGFKVCRRNWSQQELTECLDSPGSWRTARVFPKTMIPSFDDLAAHKPWQKSELLLKAGVSQRDLLSPFSHFRGVETHEDSLSMAKSGSVVDSHSLSSTAVSTRTRRTPLRCARRNSLRQSHGEAAVYFQHVARPHCARGFFIKDTQPGWPYQPTP